MTLVDTSALLAVCLREPGFEEADEVLESGEGWVAAPTWLEARVRLDSLAHGQELLSLLDTTVAGTLDITRQVADAAYEIRDATQGRIPTVDCLIAGAARVHDMRLLHRDRHMAAIPSKLVKQKMLPSK